MQASLWRRMKNPKTPNIMKKSLLAIVMATATLMPISAQETVKTLYSGEPKVVTWENTLTIPAEEFAADVNVGNYIYVTFSETTDVIEIKANGTWLPGSRFTQLGDNATEFKAYITSDMLAALKEYGLEICGAQFTVTGVSICDDGFLMPQGAIWGGYFWIDEWNTMELFKTAFANYDGQRYMDIYLSGDNGDYDGYFLKVLTRWDPETLWANNDQITHTPTVATVDLKGIDVAASLADVNALMIQGNKESGNPFNITAVVLRSESATTGVITGIDPEASTSPIDIYTLQGMKIKSNVPANEAADNLPSGLYIIGNKKVFIR